MTLWDDVDERVLRWVFSRPPSFDNMEVLDFPTRDPVAFEPLEGLDTRTLTESLLRLHGHGLIDGESGGTLGGIEHWHSLRVTALGLVYLGEWPDLDLVARASTIHHVLRVAAEGAPEQEQSALKRAAGVLGRTADAVVRDTITNVAGSAGAEAVDDS